MHPGPVRHSEYGTTWARPRPLWCPLGSALSALGSYHRRLVSCFHFLTLLEPKCPS
jgi:hypothetical protein